ncbi:hypothetical protein HY484_03235 [Candidatus Woesearchaeota archaeon]|nr:hypothetical protein [Candidatus Woesearchaeota archaeon]
MKFKVISETPVGLHEVKEELLRVKSRDNELSFRAQKTVDYLEQVVSIAPAKLKELLQKLAKLEVPRLKEQHLLKLVDVLPTTQKDVKTVLQGYAVTVTNDNLKKIAETISDVNKEK